ncbi:MAG: ABC transporter ATP-binding protein [Candidatus Sumerlaeaceae bacterium]|nr:ABC transporter ATP-binding protein [Candidatus Sumerlaeaceae bacterium]
MTDATRLEARLGKRRGEMMVRADFALAGGGEDRVLVLFGPSASGKSTILRCLAGLERPDEGRVSFGGEIWSDAASGKFVAPQYRSIGFMAQDYALFPHLDVRENIAYGVGARNATEAKARVGELLERFGIGDVASRKPAELSGGQQQRVALARALAREPGLLLLDEPLSALDAPTRMTLRRELREVIEPIEIPAIVVTHDPAEAELLGHTVLVLDAGQVLQMGPVREVFASPCSRRVAEIVGFENVVGHADLKNHPQLLSIVNNNAENRAWGAVCFRAHAVEVMRSGSGLRGRLTHIEPEGPLVRMEIDCGVALVALVPAATWGTVAARIGDEVVCRVSDGAWRFVAD